MSEAKKFLLKRIDPAAPRIITWPVPVPVPVDGGKTEVQELHTRFAVLSQERVDELTSPDAMIAWSKDKTKPQYASPLLWEVVKGFPDFREEEGGKVLKDEDAIPMLLSQSYVCVALTGEFYNMMSGRARKN